jgi:hypothetical protein
MQKVPSAGAEHAVLAEPACRSLAHSPEFQAVGRVSASRDDLGDRGEEVGCRCRLLGLRRRVSRGGIDRLRDLDQVLPA